MSDQNRNGGKPGTLEPETPELEHAFEAGKEWSLADLGANAMVLIREPELVLAEAQRAAAALVALVKARPKKIQFNGKDFITFEDWQTVGQFFGITAGGGATRYVEYAVGDAKVHGFEATATALLVASRQVISSADAMCLDDEPNWKKKPLFQIRSMAQTRACAKALRNVLGWVVVLAGYTPDEDIEGEAQRQANSQGASKNAGSTLNRTEVKAFWAAVKSGGKTNDQVHAYFRSLGIAESDKMPKEKLDAALKWAVTRQPGDAAGPSAGAATGTGA
jgi:hypothetical protein